jgi:glycosidase
MRILFDSRQEKYKTPFGTVTPAQDCILRVLIPTACRAVGAETVLEDCDGQPFAAFPFSPAGREGAYDVFSCTFRLVRCGLYFYYFRITVPSGTFRLFRQGSDTNMEAGDKWQLSCVPAELTVPSWAVGSVLYQIFPDRFYQFGTCDTTGKLQPFWLHAGKSETPCFRPDEHGEVRNNDFYGGNFRGIQEKLPYLKSLGVGILYLNPIVKAFSNHRYDAADFKTPDPLLGTETEFRALCSAAHTLGIRVILDGVFSHTGSNSVYFDANGVFGHGAVSDPASPYREWYQFRHYPDDYTAWWGIRTLPCIDKHNESYANYIIDAEDSVVAHWMALGADGFRLDVVDELPDDFVLRLKRRIRSIRPDALLIGEVWEDASNKIAYGISRRYFVDAELDSVMNYPWQKALIAFVKERDDGAALGGSIMTLAENYPPQVLCCTMNLLGTHDTARILTVLGTEFHGSKEETAERYLTPQERALGLQRLRMAAFLQFTLPGMPSIYYGDEAGMEGFADPFNRRFFPWGREDSALQAYYRALGEMRNSTQELREGDIRVVQAGEGRLLFSRGTEAGCVLVLVNRTSEPWHLEQRGEVCFAVLLEEKTPDALTLSPGGFCALRLPGRPCC